MWKNIAIAILTFTHYWGACKPLHRWKPGEKPPVWVTPWQSYCPLIDRIKTMTYPIYKINKKEENIKKLPNIVERWIKIIVLSIYAGILLGVALFVLQLILKDK